ncbi:MAG: SynChlorMet cassette protein ScmC [Deltaproteobacteria bacterium]|nr:SynChlorMet cassette protein ScmC [Deltaproteobacteria bacterium]
MYTVSFSSQHVWNLTAAPEAHWWLDHFASVMSLPRCVDSAGPRIVVSSSADTARPVKSNGRPGFGGAYGRFVWQPETGDIFVDIPSDIRKEPGARSSSFKSLLLAMAALMPSDGGFLLHAATLVKDGQAVLVAASSGGGKSTTARRVPSPWTAPGDECCFLAPDGPNGYRVHVLPTWSLVAAGAGVKVSWDTQRSYPVRAVCILKQDDHDSLSPLGITAGTVCLSDAARQAVWFPVTMMDESLRAWFLHRSFEAACAAAANIPVFLLRSSLTGCFWEELETALW